MKHLIRNSMIGGLASIMVLGSAFTSLAQSDGVINYNDTYTEGGEIFAFMIDEEDISGPVHLFSNANFTFSIDKDALLQDHYKDYLSKYNISLGNVWIAAVGPDHWARPITRSPYDDGYGAPEVKQVSDGVYSLEGLDIMPDTVYAIAVEAYGSAIPTGSSGGANAGGGGLSGYTTSLFCVYSGLANTADTSGNTAGTGSGDSSESSDDDGNYFWMHDNVGWWVQCTDGTYLTNCWYYSKPSEAWYYLGADGYMLTNTVTPDGFTVNADGVYVP